MSLDLIAATSTLPGLATAGTQTMGGDKTFTGSTQFSGLYSKIGRLVNNRKFPFTLP
jgi:hypothetical protein